MSFTGINSLDQSIGKANTWSAEIADELGAEDRRLAYRATGAWLHALRDRLPVTIAAKLTAQLLELLRGVCYDGGKPSRGPVKFGSREYVQRFARDAGIHDADVPRAASLVTRVVRRHVSVGALDEALYALPRGLRQLIGLIESWGRDGGALTALAARAPSPALKWREHVPASALASGVADAGRPGSTDRRRPARKARAYRSTASACFDEAPGA